MPLRRPTRSQSWPRKSLARTHSPDPISLHMPSEDDQSIDIVHDPSTLIASTLSTDGIPQSESPFQPALVNASFSSHDKATLRPETNINSHPMMAPTFEPRPFPSKISAARTELQKEREYELAQGSDCDSKSDNSDDRLDSSDSESDGDSDKKHNTYIPQKSPCGKILDELMALTGLEEVKEQFLVIKSKVWTSRRQRARTDKDRFNAIFQGNPGTGKTTVARLYAKFLYAMKVIPRKTFWEASGAKLAFKGPKDTESEIRYFISSGGGVIFVDEAYQLTASHSSFGGRQVLDILLTEMETNIGKLVVIFAGYKEEMESFFEHNPGLASRIPYTIGFDDFDNTELLEIMKQNIINKYHGAMEVEGGLDGVYMRIVIRRLARQRESKGFGNARSVENLLATISERQATRLRRERQLDAYGKRKRQDLMTFTKEDLIGPDPSEAILKCDAWLKLQELVGLEDVKKSAQNMIETIQANYIRELREQAPLEFSLNRVFLGSPGTGKTTVAKLYGRILADIGMLSNGEVVVKNPADFIGSALGQSEAKTKAILAATLGKVLIIDEAYGLHSGGGKNNGGSGDTYKSSVIDTLVAEIQAVPGDDRCVLLLGYEHQLLEMFQYANPGLARRFAIEDPFRFTDYNLPQLEKMLYKKMKEQDLRASPQVVAVARNMLDRARMRPNFSNGGEVAMCLDRAKQNYLTREGKKPVRERSYNGVLEPPDFDPDFNRINKDSTCREYLQGAVSTKIIELLEGYQTMASRARAAELDPRELVPTRFTFKGPPGTGKTTTARSMGKVFYDMGLLSTKDVVECSSADLIGQFVGTTAPKTKAKLASALGKVLLIDDAYRLAEGQFGTEAVTEMIHLLSSPQYLGKIIVILAGHTKDMDKLMAMQPNFCGLFPEEILFENVDPDACMAILKRDLEESKIHAPDFHYPLSPQGQEIRDMFSALRALASWSNARDIKNLAKQIAVALYKSSLETVRVETPNGPVNRVILLPSVALECMERMLRIQTTRAMAILEKELFKLQDPPNQATDFAHQEHCSVDIDIKTTASTSPAVDVMPDATKTDASRTEAHTETLTSQKNKEKKGRQLQKLLAKMGPCEMGYEWDEVDGGFCCHGGGHYMSRSEAEKLCFGSL